MNYSSEIIRQKWSIDFNLNYKFVYSLFFNNNPFRIFNHFNMDTLKSWIAYMGSSNNFQFMYFMFVSVEIRFPCILFWTTLSFIFFSAVWFLYTWAFCLSLYFELFSFIHMQNFVAIWIGLTKKKDHFVVWFILFFLLSSEKSTWHKYCGYRTEMFQKR